MATDKKLSELPVTTAVADTDNFYLTDPSSKKVSARTVKDYAKNEEI